MAKKPVKKSGAAAKPKAKSKTTPKAKTTVKVKKTAPRPKGQALKAKAPAKGATRAKVAKTAKGRSTVERPEIEKYIPQAIEPKWQQKWESDQLYRAVVDPKRKKHYALTMLPYPSGDLHIGHWYAMTPSDARARYMRMKGYNVLFPMGFDAFGLPAENAAIKDGVHPMKRTFQNIERMRAQLRS